jgi:hypothetical protein
VRKLWRAIAALPQAVSPVRERPRLHQEERSVTVIRPTAPRCLVGAALSESTLPVGCVPAIADYRPTVTTRNGVRAGRLIDDVVLTVAACYKGMTC